MDTGPGMLEIVAATAGVKLGALLTGGLIAVYFLRWLDKRAFVQEVKKFSAGTGIYYGLRFAGTVIAVAVAIS